MAHRNRVAGLPHDTHLSLGRPPGTSWGGPPPRVPSCRRTGRWRNCVASWADRGTWPLPAISITKAVAADTPFKKSSSCWAGVRSKSVAVIPALATKMVRAAVEASTL